MFTGFFSPVMLIMKVNKGKRSIPKVMNQLREEINLGNKLIPGKHIRLNNKGTLTN